jgi:hypothetical protein
MREEIETWCKRSFVTLLFSNKSDGLLELAATELQYITGEVSMMTLVIITTILRLHRLV